MTGLRWADYVLAYGDEIAGLWQARDTGEASTLVILGAGFDPRALVGLRTLADAGADQRVTIAVVDMPVGRAEPTTAELATSNAQALAELADRRGYQIKRVPYPNSIDRRAAGQVISRSIQAGGLVDPTGLVIVDVSGLPASLTFPIIGGMLAAVDGGMFRGDLQVLVCENPLMDRAIVEEGAADPGPVSGFNHGLTEAGRDIVRIWAPVLGERQSEQLEALYAYLEPNEITPVLPFPAANPRRADDLLIELRELLFGRMAVEPGNFIYAHETNPFDVYRALSRLSDRFHDALSPIGDSTVVTSVHGSKMLSIGVLLAAWERRLPVVAATPTDYMIMEGTDLVEVASRNRLACLWLAGEPYR